MPSSQGRGRGTATPSWLLSGKYGPSDKSSIGYERVSEKSNNVYVFKLVRSLRTANCSLRRMPISRENNLPHIIVPAD